MRPELGRNRMARLVSTYLLCRCLGVVLIAGSALAARAEPPLSIGNRRQLLIDDRFVQQPRGIQFVVHPPQKTGEKVIQSEPGQSLGGYHCVLYEAGVYHLWYTAGGGILYARSSDGIHFEKPDLNFATAETDGTKPPANLVVGRGVGGVKEGTHGLMVFLDPKAAAAERFKLVANPHEFESQLQVFSSPDGLHWRHSLSNIITFNNTVKPHHLDSQNVIFWDDRLGKYVAYFRKNMRTEGSQGRTVARQEAPDLVHFSRVEDSPVVMEADPKHELEWGPKGRIARLDTYTSGAIKYPWAQDAYFMFPTEYYHYGAQIAEFKKEAPINAGPLDTRFASSRDGVKWERYDHRPFVGIGMKGQFDSRRIYMVYGIVPAQNERELYMYYMGTSEPHGWGRDDRNNRLLTSAGVEPAGVPSAISRVVLRRDGFVSVRSAYAGGEFTTPVLQFQGQQLLLNIDTAASGELRVEIQDETGKPIPGYTLNDCDLVHTANEINRVVKWNGNSALESLSGKPVRLRFVMRDVDVYAFQFADRGGV